MAHAVPEDTQVNTRINKKIKEQGDAAFASIGVTPSQAIRGLYEYAIRHSNEPEKLAEVIKFQTPEEKSQHDEERARKRAAFQRLKSIQKDFCVEVGIEQLTWQEIWGDKTDKEILGEAQYEHAIEKGRIFS